MTACTQQDVERMLTYVPPARCQYALRYRHLFGQWTCLKAWEMVYLLSGIDQDWSVGEFGKPYISGAVHFSVSHCKCGVAAAVDNMPIGIDMESVRQVDETLIQHTMNTSEQDTIHSASQPDVVFTQLWTQKEAVLKCLGTGITSDLRDVLTSASHLHLQTINQLDKGYILTICTH